ncbi:MAG TPA: DoxX family protein [Haliangiales bacterium]|nr:DoxX family protein [Haliangiales bacterium]
MLGRIHEIIDVWSKRLAWAPPTLARVAMGVAFILTGWGKLHGLEQVTSYFTDLGIPLPGLMAPFVATVELVGGILLLVGLGTRVAAVMLATTMVVALITAKWKNAESKIELLGELEFAYLTIFVWLAVAGAGPLSLDRLLARRPARPVAT